MELEIEKTEVISADNIQVEVPNAVEISEGNKDYEVSVVKKEYTIIGDSIFIPSMYEDAPPWLREFIDTTIDVAVINRDQSLIDKMHAILTAMDYVPKNQYTEQINQIISEDGIINSRIATLNSNLTDAINTTNATVAEINLTYASKDEAAAIANNVITASLSGSGEIGSALIQLQEAYATLESTTAQSISTLESVMEGEITGNATAMETIRTYVGIDEVGASTGTGLSAYLEASDGTIGGADSQLANDVRVTAEGVESKFAYNSIVNINGTYKKSGFGLSTNYTSGNGTQANPYVSEFWINASKLKFTNDNVTGQVAPFTIDASGSQPQITFNGKITFGSGQVGTIDQAIAAVVETVAVGDKNINITDNLIPTTSLVADTNNSGYQFIGTPTKSMSAGLESFSEPQIVLDTNDEVYSPYVDEVTIPYYYRFGVKGITNLDSFKIVTINSSNIVGYNNVTVTMEAGQTLFADNWYTVDGIINPIGGNTTADGDIRDINGVKVGSINNFVMPSGTTKVLLGWIANCTISRMKLCNITADTITSDYSSVNGQLADLRNQINSIDVNWNNLSGKDVFAQKLGYPTYAALEAAAAAGKTVVVGGYVNTNLIQAGAITANQINTTGLIAENISAEEIFGKTLSGTVINGARINGSVIKTSYLDLDGELEVLTNYHISVATRNANPSLYTDAVYISADNEYRIPSMSNLKSLLKEVGNIYGPYLTGDYTLTSELYSYASANIGTNRKAVKARPTINIGISPSSHIPENHLYSSFFDTNNSGSGYFRFYVGNLLILSVVKSGSSVSYSGLAGSGSIAPAAYNQFNTVNLSYGGMALSIKRTTFYGDRLYVAYGGATTLKPINDWSSGQIRVEAGGPSQSLVGLRLPEITINNLN